MSDPRTSADDSLLSLAFSMYSNPGAYALLVGAGTSYASGIPTAWGVLTDLCGRVAAYDGVDLGDEDPAAWYERTRGEEPTYGRLLETLAKTPALRQALLEDYFELTDEDRETGAKQPTAAHEAIARLVADGTVKVIITLNFDRLIEQALRKAGIEPTVITHPSEVEGMRPLHQLEACVIHLHGDFKNPESMLNTDEELAGYAPATQRLLERIVEDYGLLVAGWSATYDTALRTTIEARHNVARYPLAWVEPFGLTTEGRQLLELKKGTALKATADDVLGRLVDAVEALRMRNAIHPLTIPVAVATAKRELSGRTVAVGVHDTLNKTFAVLHQHPDFWYSELNQEADAGGYQAILSRIEEATRLPAALVATLTYWGGAAEDSWWLPELDRFSHRASGGGVTRLLEIRRTVGVWLFYAAGVSATAAGRWELLKTMFNTRVPHHDMSRNRQTLNQFYEPEYIFADRGRAWDFYDRLSPLLLEALRISPAALDDAWQTFELLRHATQISGNRGYDQFAADIEAAHANMLGAEAELAHPAAGGYASARETYEAQRSNYLFHVDKLVGLTRYGRVHVLTADRMSPVDKHVVLHEARLTSDIEAQAKKHPFITAGLFDGAVQAAAALRAASLGLGKVGNELAWARVSNRVGEIPMTMWLDSAESAEEAGTSTLPE